MKASEAIKILEALDPSHEVTLTIGSPKQIKFPQNPMWNTVQVPFFVDRHWPIQPNTITCKSMVH